MSTSYTPETGYHPDVIEAKWQARWADRATNQPDLDGAAKPFYNLMMFPYPSAEGLHVGNFFAFTGALGSAGDLTRVSTYQATICLGSSGCGPKISVPCLPSWKPTNLLRGFQCLGRQILTSLDQDGVAFDDG